MLTRKKLDELCDWIADGFSFKEAVRALKVAEADAKRAFDGVKAALGYQGTVTAYRGTEFYVKGNRT